jgi:hypothetical protein
VNSHLPGFWIAPQRQADQPGNDDRHTDDEERRAADPLVGGLNEAVEGRAPSLGARRGTLDLLAHARQPMLNHHPSKVRPFTLLTLTACAITVE